MPNVTDFESCYIKSTVEYLNGNEDPDMSWVSSTTDGKRPTLFQGLTESKVLDTIVELKSKMSAAGVCGDGDEWSYSRSNKDGSDLLNETQNTNVELKLGVATDFNSGVGVMSMILDGFPDPGFGRAPQRKEWRKRYQESGFSDSTMEEILAEQDKLNEEVVALLTPFIGDELNETGNRTLYMMSLGVHTEKDIKKGIQNLGKYTRFVFSESGWGEKKYQGASSWSFSGIEYTKSRRLNLTFSAPGGFSIKFTYHFKNTYRFKDEATGEPVFTVEARAGMGSPCFNGWIRK